MPALYIEGWLSRKGKVWQRNSKGYVQSGKGQPLGKNQRIQRKWPVRALRKEVMCWQELMWQELAKYERQERGSMEGRLAQRV